MSTERDPVRSEAVPYLGLGREDRTHDLDLTEHCGREDVEAGAVREKQLCNVAAAHVSRGSERGFPVATAPVPRGICEGGLVGECVANGVEIAVAIGHE